MTGSRSSTAAAVALLLGVGVSYVACGDDDPASPAGDPRFDLLCPSPGGACGNADGPLRVGVAMRDITPVITETFRDCGLDGLCPGDTGYTAPDSGEGNGDFEGHPSIVDGPETVDDVNGNGFFDAVWIAGFGNAHPAQGVHDPLWARALVIRKGETTIALVAVDLVGYFYDEVQRIREALDPALGIDLLLVSASHTHEGPDSVGIWGFDEGTSGVNPAYMDSVRASIAEAVEEAVGNLTEARVIAAAGASGVHPDPTVTADVGVGNLIRDGRDPVVIDDEIRVLRFVDVNDDSTLSTLVNWQNHPEALCSGNTLLSSDFVHYLRQAVENGIDRGGVTEPGLGGMAIYINGAVGGLMTPLHIELVDLDGTVIPHACNTVTDAGDPLFARARAFGELAALDALRVLRQEGAEMTATDLSFATKTVRIPVENWGYHAMFLTEVFYGRTLYDFDRTQQITEANLPKLETEIAVINLGDAQALTAPGELFPEWFIGGYDGSKTGGSQDLIDSWFNQPPTTPFACTVNGDCDGVEVQPGHVCPQYRCVCTGGVCYDDDYNPPPLHEAPAGPYLRDRMTRPVKLLFGLTPDELGYIVPPYNFQLDDRLPYVDDAPGDHYEETNSIGADIGPIVEKTLIDLLAVAP